MATTATQTSTKTACPPDSGEHSRSRFWAFCLVLLLFPTIFLLSSIPIVRSASFPRASADPFLLHPDYPYSLRHADCGVLIAGDSTAVTGLDPTVIEARTGMKTCNIAQTQSILKIVGTRALDDYFKHNRPPKFLVFAIAPESFSQSKQGLFWPEGLTVLVRRDLPRAFFVLLAHPQQAYDFAMWAIKARVAAVRSVPDFSTTRRYFHEHKGLIVLPKAPETACIKVWTQAPPNRAWLNSFRNKYSRGGTQVLIDVSPIPSCAAHLGEIRASLRGLTNNSLPVYPIGMFCDLDRHLTLQGADRNSIEVAQQIIASERTNARANSRNLAAPLKHPGKPI